jgi:NAD(P)H-dependent FMN reductase
MEIQLKILIVSSSQREKSKSVEVAKYVQTNILNNLTDIESSTLDLSLYPFLLDHYGVGRSDPSSLVKNKDEVLSQLYACDAIVIIAPEWGGMIPPALVNLLLLSANGSASGLPLLSALGRHATRAALVDSDPNQACCAAVQGDVWARPSARPAAVWATHPAKKSRAMPGSGELGLLL